MATLKKAPQPPHFLSRTDYLAAEALQFRTISAQFDSVAVASDSEAIQRSMPAAPGLLRR